MTKRKKPAPKMKLKNGATVDVQKAVIALDDLRKMLDEHPDRLQSLLALVQGRPQDAHPDHVEYLTRFLYVGPDGKVGQEVADVLLSALVNTGDGLVLVNPFKMETAQDKLIVDRAYEHRYDALMDDLFPRGRPWGSRD